MWSIDYIEDTRQLDSEWKPIPGTGEKRPCEHCGKLHEIHVGIRDPKTNERMMVGSTCAKDMVSDSSRLTTRSLRGMAIERGKRQKAAKIAERLLATGERRPMVFGSMISEACNYDGMLGHYVEEHVRSLNITWTAC